MDAGHGRKGLMHVLRGASRFARSRAALFALAAAAALWALFLRPLPRHARSAIPYALYVAAPPRELVQGDHLQLLYHFDLLRSYLRGDIPWFRNLYEFNTSDADIPARPDFCYFPFALPYAALREVGASPAFAWNVAQALSVLLGFFLCRALARRCGAGSGGATAAAALATCVPYRWVVLAGGSPTGFGIGLVPGVALGLDIAVRDRKARGGALAGAMVLCCYAADLHCFLFAALAAPFWCAASLLICDESPFTRRRACGVVRALVPFAAGGALAAAIGTAAKRAYASTSVAGGRTLAEIEAHSPDWHAFFDPHYFSHYPDMFHMGRLLPAALFAAGLALVASAALGIARARTSRRRAALAASSAQGSPRPIVLHPAFSNGPGAGQPGPWKRLSDLRAALAGLLFAAGILAVVALALGTHGPEDGLPLRALRKLVPPFRLVRQPLKAFCLLPAFYAAFFALAWRAARTAPALFRAVFPRAAEQAAPVWMRRHWPLSAPSASPRRTARRSLRTRRAALFAAATLFIALIALDCSRGVHAGLCVLPPPNKAWSAVAADAAARGATPRALVLPVWPGDSSWSSTYEYRAMQSGVRMLNGYAAVTRPDYVERVFRRFETMTEGDFTPDQAAGLREFGVTAIILQEDAFPAKVSPFAFGRTLRRHLANPALRLVAHDRGAWVFAPEAKTADLPREHRAEDSALAAPTRVWTLSEPQTNAATRVRSFAAANAGRCGWLVRAEADRELTLVTWAKGDSDSVRTNSFPAVADAPSGSWRVEWVPAPDPGQELWTHLATPGQARISYVAYAENPALGQAPRPAADGTLRLGAADLIHEFGSTVLDESGEPRGLRFEPVSDSDDSVVAIYGPRLPLPLPPGRYSLAAESDCGGFAPTVGEIETDGTTPIDFAIIWDGKTPSTLFCAALRPVKNKQPAESRTTETDK